MENTVKEEMLLLFSDFLDKHLDNYIMRSDNTEQEKKVSSNKCKIRRRVMMNGELVWVTADNEQEYAQKLMSAMSDASNEAKKHNFKDYAEDWFEVFSKPNIGETTAITYRRQLDYYIYPTIGDMFIEDIKPSDVQKVFNNVKSSKRETKNKVKIVLNQILKKAVEDRLIMYNPLQSTTLRISGQASTMTEPYTVEQMQYLAAHIGDLTNPSDRAWLALSVSLPLRPEETLGAKWCNLEPETGVLHIENTVTHPTRNEAHFKPYLKNASSVRDLVIPEAMRKFVLPCGRPDEFIVGGANPLSYTQVRRMRDRIARETGFSEQIIPRRFRTTVATDISATTHDLKLVQRALGHSTPQMTLKHYDKGRNTVTDASNAIISCYNFGSM